VHKDAITAILMNWLSCFQKELDHDAEVFSLSILVGKGADIKCKGEESVEVG